MAKRKRELLHVVWSKVVFVIQNIVMGRARCSKQTSVWLKIKIKLCRRSHLCKGDQNWHSCLFFDLPLSTTNPAGQFPLRSPWPCWGKKRTRCCFNFNEYGGYYRLTVMALSNNNNSQLWLWWQVESFASSYILCWAKSMPRRVCNKPLIFGISAINVSEFVPTHAMRHTIVDNLFELPFTDTITEEYDSFGEGRFLLARLHFITNMHFDTVLQKISHQN